MKQMFYGGVHPAEHKEATEQKPIQPLSNAPAPGRHPDVHAHRRAL